MSPHRSVSTVKYAVSTRCTAMVAPSTTPVSPIPPTVAQNSSGSFPSGPTPSGVRVRISPSAHSRSSERT